MLSVIVIGILLAIALCVGLTVARANRELTCFGCGHEFGPYEHVHLDVGALYVRRYCDKCARAAGLP